MIYDLTQIGSLFMNVKQVLVIRKDLNMRKGKIAAQAAHASNVFLIDKIKQLRDRPGEVLFTRQELDWIDNKFTKICVSVDSEQEMLELYDLAKASDLYVSKIVDSGATEFNGVPTLTALAIGPDISELIDNVTGHLQLL
jgi:PTH2 family peptidyl-tRNA hydrolase